MLTEAIHSINSSLGILSCTINCDTGHVIHLDTLGQIGTSVTDGRASDRIIKCLCFDVSAAELSRGSLERGQSLFVNNGPFGVNGKPYTTLTALR